MLAHLPARGAVDAGIGHAGLPLAQMGIEFSEGGKSVPRQRIVAHILHIAFYLSLMLRGVRTARHGRDAVVAAEVGKLRVELWIKPIRPLHGRPQVIEIEQHGHPAEGTQGVLHRPQETLGILPPDGLAIALARAGEHRAKDPAPAALPRLVWIRQHGALHEVYLQFLTRLALHALHPPWLVGAQSGHKAFDRVVGTLKPVRRTQILPDAFRRQPRLNRRLDNRPPRLAPALGPDGHFGSRGGALCRSRAL